MFFEEKWAQTRNSNGCVVRRNIPELKKQKTDEVLRKYHEGTCAACIRVLFFYAETGWWVVILPVPALP